jgi:ribosomal protein S18 acetylase RimI-like enzyme
MVLEISAVNSPEEISLCADWMVASNPWSVLHFSHAQCVESLSSPQLQINAAFQDGEMLGFLASMEHGIGFEPMIEYLCTSPEHRSQGIGSQLINHFEQSLFPESDNLYMFVSDINPNAIRLYNRLGYQQVGAWPNFNLEGQTEFLLRKSRRPIQAKYLKS